MPWLMLLAFLIVVLIAWGMVRFANWFVNDRPASECGRDGHACALCAGRGAARLSPVVSLDCLDRRRTCGCCDGCGHECHEAVAA